jgi:hypothetical protein
MEELAVEGYMLLAERLRREQDKDVIKVLVLYYYFLQQFLVNTACAQPEKLIYSTGINIYTSKSLKRILK